jgi:heat shock protein HtpX
MSLVKRLFLYLFITLSVDVTVFMVISKFGLHGYLTQYGVDYLALAGICMRLSVSAALIALVLSPEMTKLAMGVELIAPSTSDSEKRQLIQKVYQLARRAGLHTMPQVGIYHSSDVNAFLTGPKSRPLIAVSRGLLSKMHEAEIEGVLAREISHISKLRGFWGLLRIVAIVIAGVCSLCYVTL